jgi:hypothetical protein
MFLVRVEKGLRRLRFVESLLSLQAADDFDAQGRLAKTIRCKTSLVTVPPSPIGPKQPLRSSRAIKEIEK